MYCDERIQLLMTGSGSQQLPAQYVLSDTIHLLKRVPCNCHRQAI